MSFLVHRKLFSLTSASLHDTLTFVNHWLQSTLFSVCRNMMSGWKKIQPHFKKKSPV